MPLTDVQIRKIKASGDDYQITDGNALYLIIRKKGTKTWRYEFRLDGKKQKYHYGNYPEITLDNARKIHAIARQLVELGKHPSTLLDDTKAKQMIIDGHGIKEIEARVIANKEAKAASTLPTFGDAAAQYKSEWVDSHWKDPNKGFLPVTRHLLPKLTDKPLEAIDVPMLRELIYDIRERIGTPTALSCHAWVDRIFGYAVEHNLCTSNPAKSIKPARVGNRNKRERWLTTPEIRRYLVCLYQANCYRGYKLGLHLLLMLALRKTELCGAAWSEIDFEKGEMLIPAGRMKTKKDHLVMLPLQAIEMLCELKRLACESPWVMPMPTNPNRAMHGNNLLGAHHAALADGDISDYNIHDHRHTASTHMREQGHSPEVVETALSHAIPGMAGVYSHAQYKTQRREMLQSWADFLDGVMNERVVIQATFRKAI